MHMLQSGVAFSVIALWLGHERMTTTRRYVEADLAMKKAALALLQEPGMELAQYQPPDALMQFLQDLYSPCRGAIAPIPGGTGVGAETLPRCHCVPLAIMGLSCRHLPQCECPLT